jgi:hypothetical protein
MHFQRRSATKMSSEQLETAELQIQQQADIPVQGTLIVVLFTLLVVSIIQYYRLVFSATHKRDCL